MNDISVTLSTTGFVMNIKDPKINEILIQNIPVCSVKMYMVCNIPVEVLTKSLLSLSKGVIIEEDTKRVIVGTNTNYYLVDYVVEKRNQFEDEFFKRWKETHSLLFEFALAGNTDRFNALLSIRGFWLRDAWSFLNTFEGNTMEILKMKGGIGQ